MTAALPPRRLHPRDLAKTDAELSSVRTSRAYGRIGDGDLSALVWAEAAIPERYLDGDGLPAVTLDQMISPDVPQQVLDAAAQFVRAAVDRGEGGLMLTGPMGHGKSQVAAACLFEIALCADPTWWPTPRRDWTGHGHKEGGPPAALWVDPANYLNEQRQTFGSSLLTSSQIQERQTVRAALESKKRASSPGVLVVDDLGRSQRAEGTEWERDQIEMLLRARYDLKLPVIVTTNHSLLELGERYNVADILKEMCDVVGYTRSQGSRRAAAGLRRRAG